MKPALINILKAGNPDCVHFEKIDSEQIGICKKCGRVVDYKPAVIGASEQVGFTSQAFDGGKHAVVWIW